MNNAFVYNCCIISVFVAVHFLDDDLTIFSISLISLKNARAALTVAVYCNK